MYWLFSSPIQCVRVIHLSSVLKSAYFVFVIVHGGWMALSLSLFFFHSLSLLVQSITKSQASVANETGIEKTITTINNNNMKLLKWNKETRKRAINKSCCCFIFSQPHYPKAALFRISNRTNDKESQCKKHHTHTAKTKPQQTVLLRFFNDAIINICV